MKLLASSLAHYCDYLDAQCKKVKENHTFPTPVRSMPDSTTIKIFKLCTAHRCLVQFNELNKTLDSKEPYECIFLNDYTPNDPRKKYEYLQSLERSGCNHMLVVITHSSGNNVGNLYFAWKVPHTEALESILDRSQKVIEEIRPRLPSLAGYPEE